MSRLALRLRSDMLIWGGRNRRSSQWTALVPASHEGIGVRGPSNLGDLGNKGIGHAVCYIE